jgi:hypothetical protein
MKRNPVSQALYSAQETGFLIVLMGAIDAALLYPAWTIGE